MNTYLEIGRSIYQLPRRETISRDIYDLSHIDGVAKEHGINLYPDSGILLERLGSEIKNVTKNKYIDASPLYVKEITSDPVLRTAGVFHRNLIRPMITLASDAHKLTSQEVTDFCKQLVTSEGVSIVISIAQCKTLSPRRTGSPNAQIDLAELEMYSNLATVCNTANSLGLNIKFILLDESTALPPDNLLGITPHDIVANRHISSEYLKKRRADDHVIIRSLHHSVSDPLNSQYEQLFMQRYQDFFRQINHDLATIAVTNTFDTPNKATIEAFVLFDCIPDNILVLRGVDPKVRESVNSPKDLPNIPDGILEEVISLAAICEAELSLREEAAKRVTQKDFPEYPEYNPHGRVKAGITRRDSRLSLLPHPTRFNGRTTFPMHGLAVYNSDNTFGGIAPASQLKEGSSVQIIRSNIENKPLFAKIL